MLAWLAWLGLALVAAAAAYRFRSKYYDPMADLSRDGKAGDNTFTYACRDGEGGYFHHDGQDGRQT